MNTYLYQGGNNGNVFANFIIENDLYNPEYFCDDYVNMIGQSILYSNPNFTKWIEYNDFWEDFVYSMNELDCPVMI